MKRTKRKTIALKNFHKRWCDNEKSNTLNITNQYVRAVEITQDEFDPSINDPDSDNYDPGGGLGVGNSPTLTNGNKRAWWEWVILGFAIVGAIALIVSLFGKKKS